METTGRRIDLKAAVEEGRAFIVEQPIEWKQAEANGDGGPTDLMIRTLASTPSRDLHEHKVLPSAFAETLNGSFKQRPLMLAFHDWAKPIGLWPDTKIEAEGVWFEGPATGKTQAGSEMHSLVQDGIVNGSSIGWWPKDDGLDFDEETDTLIISGLDLFEVSLVPLPANLDTFVEVKDAWCDRWVKSYKKNYRNRSVIAPRPARASGAATAARVIPIEAWATLAKCGSAIANRATVGKSIRATVGASVDALSPPVSAGGEDDE